MEQTGKITLRLKITMIILLLLRIVQLNPLISALIQALDCVVALLFVNVLAHVSAFVKICVCKIDFFPPRCLNYGSQTFCIIDSLLDSLHYMKFDHV